MHKNNLQIIDAHDYEGGLETAVRYIHGKWGSERNLNFYRDAITRYGEKLPRFFLLCDGSKIIGCGALLISDFTSRHDLWPWYACHYIEADYCQRNFNMHQFWHFKVHHFPSQLKFSDGALERSGKAPSENFSLALRVSSLSFRR